MRGGPFQVDGREALTDNTAIHEELIELFAEVFDGRYRTPLPEMSAS
jgi:hypothetical protein